MNDRLARANKFLDAISSSPQLLEVLLNTDSSESQTAILSTSDLYSINMELSRNKSILNSLTVPQLLDEIKEDVKTREIPEVECDKIKLVAGMSRAISDIDCALKKWKECDDRIKEINKH